MLFQLCISLAVARAADGVLILAANEVLSLGKRDSQISIFLRELAYRIILDCVIDMGHSDNDHIIKPS